MPQNKFEILASRVMSCSVKLRKQTKQEGWKVEYYKCREEGHKCKECPLWKKIERVVHLVQGKAHQQEKRKLAHLIKGKAQEGERKLRRTKEGEAVHVARPQEMQQE